VTEHDAPTRDRDHDWLLMDALHDAFRRDLDQLLNTTADHAAIRARWQIFRGQLHFHHAAEDTAMWPPVRAKLAGDPAGLALLDEMQAEHAQIDPVLAAVDEALSIDAWDRADGLLHHLQATLTRHLAHEEAEALPLISKVLTGGELRHVCRAIAREGGLRQAAIMFPWALADASSDTRQQVLARLPASARLLYRTRWLPSYRRRAPAL